MPRVVPTKVDRARKQAVYRAVRDGVKLEPLVAAQPFLFSPSGNTSAGYNAAMSYVANMVRAGYIERLAPGQYKITEEEFKLDNEPDAITAADYATAYIPTSALTVLDHEAERYAHGIPDAAPVILLLKTPPSVSSPQEDTAPEWGPHDLLLWLSSMKGVERRELVKRLKPDMVDKAVAACKRLMPVQNIAQNS